MRIIAGKFRGRRLVSASGQSVRPMTDRVRQTVFDVLSNRIDFSATSVLDLFSGSGSIGLEAISRGAPHVTFVDNSRESLTCIEKNIASLGCKDQTTIYLADVFWYLKNAGKAFDLIFVDPPYKLPEIGSIPEILAHSNVVKKDTYIVMEHSRESVVPVSPDYYETTSKQFGQTTLLILRYLEHDSNSLSDRSYK